MNFHDMPVMQFGAGWIVTFAAVFFMNGFLLSHWLLTDFRRHRTAKALACALANIALAVPFFVYFVRFFGGMSYEPYMVPLSYIAGFYLCFSVYAAGIFFFTDIFRGLRLLFRKLRLRRKNDRARFDSAETVGQVSGAMDDEPGETNSTRGATGDGAPGKRRGLPRLLNSRFTMGVAVVCVCCSLAAFYTPTNITFTQYDVAIDRGDAGPSDVRAVFISDTHVGAAVRERELDTIVAMVNEIKPDIVLLGGDIIDEGTPQHLRQYTAERLAELESLYGIYYIIGNHDAYRGDFKEVISLFEGAGIDCLIDEVVLIDDRFYLIGRDDSPLRRMPFAELEAEVTENLPAIVIDHHPRIFETRNSDAVKLQLSGHTHDGQIFPFHIADPLGMFSLQYGLYDRNGMQVIVSSGAGEYAAPVRLGSPAEILTIDIELR
jgi:predicted MPP superfamily phosphohydrolase